jgi:hypothetical protein
MIGVTADQAVDVDKTLDAGTERGLGRFGTIGLAKDICSAPAHWSDGSVEIKIIGSSRKAEWKLPHES